MKTNIKTKFGFLISLLTLFVITSSCEKDLYENSLQNNTREMHVREISLKDIEKSISTKITSEISKVKNMKYETSKEGYRIEYNSELDIYIDTDNGNVVSVDGKNFYTFPMFKDDDNKIENVLFVDNGTGEMDTYLIKYDITPQEFENLTSDQVQNIDAEYQKVFWSGGEQVCFTWITTTTVYQNCPYPGGLHSNGLQCEGEVHVNSTTLCTFVEVFGQGDSLGGNGGDGVGGDTSGGGTTGGNSSGNTIHTGIGTSPELVKMKKFVKSLPAELENWYNENESSHENIQEYLEENNFSDESTEEIKNTIDILHDGMIDGEPVLVGPNVPIDDMAEFLNCFDTSLGATITIYADQPKTGGHNVWTFSNSVGHAFITIQQGDSIASFGFYPQCSPCSLSPNNLTPNPLDFFSTSGVFGNDQGHDYNVSLSIPINSINLTNLINGVISVAESDPMYNIGYFNCTDIAISILENNSNTDIPSCESPGVWQGQTPGTLGEIIRNMTTPVGGIKNTTGGNAPNNNCN